MKKFISFSNATTSCAKGGLNWSTVFVNDEEGEYIWNLTNATDLAGNFNDSAPDKKVNWSAISQVFLNTTLHEPLANFEINESEVDVNYTFLITCNVTCRQDSTESCQGVTLKAEYNNGTFPPIDENKWFHLNTTTKQLINDKDIL